MELMIVAGEASGDLQAAALIAALKRRQPQLHFFGAGGERMAAAGCEVLVPARDLAVVGLFEVVRHLPRIHGYLRRLRREMQRRRPAAVILTDFPDFNLRLAAAARRQRIPVLYFISPQLWAWREGRVKLIRRRVRRMICIFPFEPAFYARHHIEVDYVGHPLVDEISRARPLLPSRQEFCRQHGLNLSDPIVAMLPGSRRKELEFHLPTLLEAARRLRATRRLQFVIPLAPALDDAKVASLLPHSALPEFVHLIKDSTYAALQHAEVAVVASGTATVETALIGTPMVVVYRLSSLTYWIGRRWVKSPHFAMANLIAGREVVPELIQADFNAAGIVNWVAKLLDDSATRQSMLEGLDDVRRRLGEPGAIERAAAVVMRELGTSGQTGHTVP